MNMETALTFNDVLIVPQYSEVTSRSLVDISVDLGKNFKFELPFTPANMANVTGFDMAWKFYTLKGLSLLHRFDSFENRIEIIKKLKEKAESEDILNYVGISVGVKEEDKQQLDYFVKQLGIKIVCIDIAHLDSKLGIDMIKHIAKNYPDLLLIAGTIATKEAAIRAWEAGADCVRVNLGNGSICTTRLEAGVGIPQLTAIMQVYEAKKELQPKLNRKITFISDGGKSSPSDFCKALCFGDMCMSGNYFSATNEAPGEIMEVDGVKYKQYNGSSTHKQDRIEGVKALKKYKGSVDPLIKRLKEGIQSCCSYNNALNLEQLKQNAKLIKITNNGLVESGSHNLDKIL